MIYENYKNGDSLQRQDNHTKSYKNPSSYWDVIHRQDLDMPGM
jgi:hypothetical protein